jgi:hypothetical protein
VLLLLRLVGLVLPKAELTITGGGGDVTWRLEE